MDASSNLAENIIFLIRNWVDEKLSQQTVYILRNTFEVDGQIGLEQAIIHELNKRYTSLNWTSGIGHLGVRYDLE